MATWEARVTVGPVTHTGPTTGLSVLAEGAPNKHAYLFGALDTGASGAGVFPAIRVSRIADASGVWKTQEAYGVFDPAGGQFISITALAAATGAAGGTEFVDGGTLTITKNEATEQYTWQGLVSSVTLDWADLPYAVAPGEMAPDRLASEGHEIFDSGGTSHDSTLTVPWSGFFGSMDGVDFKGATLASGDRGSWLASGSAIEPWFLATPGTFTTYASADTASAVALAIITDVPGGDGSASGGAAARFWDQDVYLAGNPFRLLVDALICPISGFLYTVRVPPEDHTRVLFGRSDDRGATITEAALHTDAGGDFAYPTVAVDPKGKVLVVWSDLNAPADRQWKTSETFGQTWSSLGSETADGGAPVDSFRLRFHPVSGHGLFTYRQATAGEVRAQVFEGYDLTTFDLIFGGPRGVAAQPTAHVGTIDVPALGHVAYRFRRAMDRQASLSENWGHTWAEEVQEASTLIRQAFALYDPKAGLHYLLYQDPAGDLNAYVSDDGTAAPVTGFAPALVIAGLDQQYAALAVGPNGELYALYQEEVLGTYVLKCRRAEAFGSLWVDA